MATDPPLGEPVDWQPVERPRRQTLEGEHVLLRPLEAERDTESLFAASHPPEGNPGIWTYLPYGPYDGVDQLRAGLESAQASEDPLFFTIVRRRDLRPLGVASYLRMEPEFGVIEIGHIWFGVPLQRTTGATEAIYLMARHVFDVLGYRRLEWKCNALNVASRRAAERFGFTFEGVFRNHMVVKGRNRDSAWYAITAEEWEPLRCAFEAWLAPENFDGEGRQRRSLSEAR